MADPKIVYDIVANAEGGGEVDRLAASLEKLDNAIDPAAAARAAELTAELQRLGAQQAAVARFQELSAATTKAAADLAAADSAASALRAEIDASGTATTAQAGRLEKLGSATQATRIELQAQTVALEASRGRLAALGIDASEAAAAEKALGDATGAIRVELQSLGASLQGVNARALVDELKQLGQQQQAIAQLRDLGTAVDKAQAELTKAEAAAAAFGAKLEGIEAPTAAQVNTQQRLSFAVVDATNNLAKQTAQLDAARGKLSALGVETTDLAAAEERLRTAAQATVEQIQQLGQQQAAVQRFQELAAATERARTALATADAGLDAFRASIASTEEPTAAEAAELDRLTAAARAAQVAVQQQAVAQAEAATALRAAGVSTAALAAAQEGARTQLTGTAAALASLSAESARTTAAANSLQAAWQTLGARSFKDVQTEAAKVRAALIEIQTTSKNPLEIKLATDAAQAKLTALQEELVLVDGSAGSLVSTFAGVGAAIAGVGLVAKPIYDLAVQTETLRRVLEQTEGSAAGAAKQMQFLRDTANTAGVSITSISESYVQFASAARSSGIAGQVVNDVFAATTRAAGNLGLSSEKVTLILQALGQMASKGTVQMEELRGQLGDSLPGALGLMAKGLGLTQAELIKVVESGQLLARDALPALATALNNVSGNGAQVEGLSASFNRLKNVVTEAGQALIDGPIGTVAGTALTAFAGVLRDVTVIAVGFNAALGIAGKTIALIAAAFTGNIASFQQFKTEFAAIFDEAAAKVSKFEESAYASGKASTAAGNAAAAAGQQAAQTAPQYDTMSGALDRAAAAHQQAATGATANSTAQTGVATAAGVATTATTALAAATTAGAGAAGTAGISWAKLTVDYTAVNAEVERGAKLADKLVASKKLEGEAAVTLAQISGNEFAALQAEATAAQGNATAIQNLADKRQTEVAVLKAQLDAEKALSAQLGDPGGERAIQIAAIEKSIAAKSAEADASTNAADKAKAEADSRRLLVATYADNSQALGTLKAAYESAKESVADMVQLQQSGIATDGQVADAKKRAAEAERLYHDAVSDATAATTRNIATMDAEQHMTQAGITAQQAFYAALGRVATAQGDERLATEAAVRSKQLEIDSIESSVAAKGKELDLTIASLQQERAALDQTSPLLAQKQQEIDARIKNAEAMKVENAARGESVTAILAETEALQRQSQAKAFANTEALDLSGLTAANKKTKADSDASNAARKAENSVPIDDSSRADLESKYASGALTSNDLAAAQANLAAAKINLAVMQKALPSTYTTDARQDVVASERLAQSIVDRLTSGKSAAPAPRAAPAPAPVPAPAPAPTPAPVPATVGAAPSVGPPSVPRVGPSSVGSTSHTVTINLTGQPSTTIATASAEDSLKVTAFLKTLQNSARSAGY